ncbi:C-type lectin domain family 2 member D-like [Strix aluco]|uniref:C-type lectin domain family 2 member D-like n=1 Tax=Strix aluco TaxID=111821 RepID=UPI003DA20F33
MIHPPEPGRIETFGARSSFWKQRDSTSQCAMGRGEGSGSCSNDGDVEKALGPWDRGETPSELPGDPEKRRQRRLGGKWHQLHRVRVPYPVLLLIGVVLVALAVAVAALSGRCGGSLAPVLACPYEWVGHRGVCYYLSSEEGSWEWSRERCSSLGASLAVLKEQWEREFLTCLKGNINCWVGLQRRGRELEWVDGSSFNQTFPVQGQEPCVYLSEDCLRAASCSQAWAYLCSKPQVLA